MPAKTDVLRVRLVADGAGKVRADMLGVEDSFKRTDKTQAKLAVGLKALGGLFTVLSAGAIAAATKNAIAFADGIDKASERAGFGAEALQELRFAAEQVGVTTQQLDDGLRRFTRRIGVFANEGGGPAAKTFENLGIAIRDATGEVRSSESILDDVVSSLEDVESAAERSAIAAQLFGDDAGPQLRLLLDQGVIGLQNLRKEARDIGAVLSDEVVENAAETQDQFSKLANVLKVQFTTALVQLGPVLVKTVNGILTLTSAINDLFGLTKEAELKNLKNDLSDLEQNARDLTESLKRNVSEIRKFAIVRELKETGQEIAEIKANIEELEKAAGDEPLGPLGTGEVAENLEKTGDALGKILDRLNPLQTRAKQFNAELAILKSTLQGEELAEAVRKLEEEFAAATGSNRELNKTLKKTEEELEDVGKAAESELKEPFTRAAENIQREFANIFSDIARHGELRFETFTDAIRDLFARLAGEIAALLVFKPQLLGGGLGGITGGLGLLGTSGPAAAGAGAGSAVGAGSVGGFLASGITGTNPLITVGFGVGAGLVGTLAGNAISEAIGLNASRAGNIGGGLGAVGGATLGFLLGGPLGLIAGGGLGGLGGSVLGNLFGGGGSDKTNFAFRTGAGGLQTPFGGLELLNQKNIDGGALLASLAQIDENLSRLLSPEQIERVRGELAGTGQSFAGVQSFDNETFDIVRTRLNRIIDAVAGNDIASQLLDRIPRGAQNVDQLVSEAQRILQLIQLFDDEGAELNQAEQALDTLNRQFDDLAHAADDLGFSLEQVEARRQQELAQLIQDFDSAIRDQILAITDPLTLALEQQARAAQERLDNAETLGADIVEVERLNALERRRIVESQFDASNKSIGNFLQSLSTGSIGGLSNAQRLSNTQDLFNRLLSESRSDPQARLQLAQLLPTLVDLTRQQLGSSSQFFQFTDSLERTLSNLIGTDATVDTLNDVGLAITQGDNAIIDTLKEEIGELKGAVVSLNADIALLLNAPQAA